MVVYHSIGMSAFAAKINWYDDDNGDKKPFEIEFTYGAATMRYLGARSQSFYGCRAFTGEMWRRLVVAGTNSPCQMKLAHTDDASLVIHVEGGEVQFLAQAVGAVVSSSFIVAVPLEQCREAILGLADELDALQAAWLAGM